MGTIGRAHMWCSASVAATHAESNDVLEDTLGDADSGGSPLWFPRIVPPIVGSSAPKGESSGALPQALRTFGPFLDAPDCLYYVRPRSGVSGDIVV